MEYDFSGWATRNDMKCSDGLTIRKGAFEGNSGKTVPLVWNHRHDDPMNILGHALLENRENGVYAYCKFNDSESGQNAKLLVEHGDVSALSIYANQLKKQAANVVHGNIREVSLVLAGANPGAYIDAVIQHGEASEEEAIIYTGEDISFSHSADTELTEEEKPDESTDRTHSETNKEKKTMAEDPKKNSEKEDPKKDSEKEETVADVFNTLSEKQKTVVYAMIGQALEDKGSDEDGEHSDEGDKKMKHNVFDNDDQTTDTLSHSDMVAVLDDAKRKGSLRDTFLAHGFDEDSLRHTNSSGGPYGVTSVDYLFPDAKTVNVAPDFISRDMQWVSNFMSGAKHMPFSRVRSIHASITADEARAKGYVKGSQKANEVFALLKRVTNPTTIYKHQKLDRDDIVDIIDFDVVAWLKVEMRMMLDEEIARAALVGDGRTTGTDDKISEECIRPIWTDSDVYAVKTPITLSANATDDDKAKAFIRAAIKSRKDYKGSGNPTMYTTEDMLTDCLLMEDGNGRVIYETVEKLRTALRVKEIITVPVMENQTRTGSGTDAGYDFTLLGIMVNPIDYGFGADKGGAVNMFDDFDIDFNQQKYLIETRCSGALQKPYSAVVLELKEAA